MMNRDDRTPLACLYHWERTRRPTRCTSLSPSVVARSSITRWAEIMREVRSMAAHLQSLNCRHAASIALAGQEHRALDHGRLGHLDGWARRRCRCIRRSTPRRCATPGLTASRA